MRKKVVWLPYDFDTAIGINNEGTLTFNYNLEDTDHTESGADVYNGQQSVMWTNLRDAFGPELKAMYKQLRSDGVLSYGVVERMFEEHQSKWPEAIFNEDSEFKYIMPLTNPEDGKPTSAYLSMLQGSKADQRKWWLYNRFRYLDSKYNAGDALTDVITLRGYAKDNITVIPYADIYPTIKFGSYLVGVRGERGNAYTLVCPLDKVNDTEIYIYSASQLASIGDISGLKVGFADFSMGTKLQNLKIGDSSESYSNANLVELYIGNNTLLKTIDVRNCPALGTGDQKTVDLSGCRNIEEVYFDGTSIGAVSLPNGGILRVLHLPGTVSNLTIRNQPELTDLTVPDYSHISTLWLEKAGIASTMAEDILREISDGSRVRLLGFDWSLASELELSELVAKIDTLRGIDETGGNVTKAQLQGSIYVPKVYQDSFDVLRDYPYVDLTYDEIGSYVYDLVGYGKVSPLLLENFNEGGPLFSMCNNAFQGVDGIGKVYLHGCYDLPGQCFRNSSITEITIDMHESTQTCYYNNSSLADCKKLIKATFKCYYAKLYSNLLNNCPLLSIVDFAGNIDFYHQTIFNAQNTSLKALIIRSTERMSTAGNSLANMFDTFITDAENLTFHIYVPSSMIEQFQTATNWATVYARHPDIYRPLENYTIDGTVTGEIDETLI